MTRYGLSKVRALVTSRYYNQLFAPTLSSIWISSSIVECVGFWRRLIQTNYLRTIFAGAHGSEAVISADTS